MIRMMVNNYDAFGNFSTEFIFIRLDLLIALSSIDRLNCIFFIIWLNSNSISFSLELKQFISNKSLAFFLFYCPAINVLCLTRKNYCYENSRKFITIFSVFYLSCIIFHLKQIFVFFITDSFTISQ